MSFFDLFLIDIQRETCILYTLFSEAFLKCKNINPYFQVYGNDTKNIPKFKLFDLASEFFFHNRII